MTYLPLFPVAGDSSEMASSGASGLKVKGLLFRADSLIPKIVIHLSQLFKKDLSPPTEFLLTPLVVSLLLLYGPHSSAPSSLA